MNKAEAQQKPIVLFPINANPLHIGHLLAINTILNYAQKLYIVLYDNPLVIPTQIAVEQLNDILSRYKDSNKIRVMSSPVDFTKINGLPDKLIINNEFFTIATSSRHIYANLQAKGYPYLIHIVKAMGWRDEFYRIAFLRSIALDNIEKIKYK